MSENNEELSVEDKMHAELEQLRSQLSAAEKDARLNRAVMDYWQARFNVLCHAWRDGNNDAVLEACRKFIKANDEAEAQAKLSETTDLRSQLSARDHQIEQWKDAHDNWVSETAANQTLLIAKANRIDELESRLAAYDACLTRLREERPAVQSALNDIGTYTELTASHEVLAAALIVRAYVFHLEHAEAATRKRIAELEQELESSRAAGRAYCAATDPQLDDLERLHDENTELKQTIAQLQSPPEGRKDIFERQAERREILKKSNNLSPVYTLVALQDIDTLLQDCARYRNAHTILMSDNARLTAANAEFARRQVDLLAALRMVAQRLREDSTVFGAEPTSAHRIVLLYNETLQIFKAIGAAVDSQQPDGGKE